MSKSIPIKLGEKILIGKIYGIPFVAKEPTFKVKERTKDGKAIGEFELQVSMEVYFEEAEG